MRNFQKVKVIAKKIQARPCFLYFDYVKDNGEISQRKVTFGIDVIKKMEKQGTPINGKGNWHSKCSEGRLGFTIRRNNELYVRGTDAADNTMKIFKVAGISNLR